jgi:hypothetical protein
MRRAKISKASDTVYSLEDIQVEEVSVVDRAANKRKFLVVKQEKEMRKSKEVIADGKGGLTIAKDEPTPSTAPAAEAPPAATATEAPPSPAGASIRMAPAAKAEMLKRCDSALMKINALKSICEKAEEVDGLSEIPQEIVDGVEGIVSTLSEGDPTEKSDVSTQLQKGRKQISIAREGKIRAAHTALAEILSDLEVVATDLVDAPAVDVAEKSEDVIAKKIDEKMLAMEDRLAKALGGIVRMMETQKEAIAKQASLIGEKSQPIMSNSPANHSSVIKGASSGQQHSWPLDMNARTVDRANLRSVGSRGR